MIAPRDATAPTMLIAVSHSLGALDGATELDVDRSDDDRAFFAAEKAALAPAFEDLFAAEQNLKRHLLLTTERLQSRVEIGDVVLDRGVRAGKNRMKLELKSTAPEAVDHVFPSDITEIVDAERHVEPGLVQQLVGRFDQIPDFAGKAALKADLEGRATRQAANFTGRTAAEVTEDSLAGLVELAVARGSDALYRLEKRLLDRFPREKVYVRAFFLDVKPSKRKPAGNGSPPDDTGGGAPRK
jgi:hypothetical protein